MLALGAAIKAEQTFGSGLANTTFNNYWNQLQQLSGAGLTAAGGVANAATGTANQISGINTGAAGANASIYGNVASSLGGQANQLLSNGNVQSWLSGGAGEAGTWDV